jgi:hypothetical protein
MNTIQSKPEICSIIPKLEEFPDISYEKEKLL